MGNYTKTELGEIKIHHNVITSIAVEAARQIPGIMRIGRNLKTYFMELVGKSNCAAVKIEFDKNNEIIITIPIIVKFGYNIPEIAAKVQENVKLSVENATNINVKEINVKVKDIEKGRILEEI
ncbi:MAG: Asp23/Gls24 family envelope stress response protein [Candidatus Omnitrophica bacterium]|nr:Asp23/Gls24 family envelope stress response protein [Candidatus Omnitrophota bacterium]MDD5352299.1 Asp23/Gls24 family envelope stress response protein [Candidatus Omnitrophota bacterium]MDD5549897.1 Asp23/Gls24 family envelope stress response protein [Candidatus Omnitrophota bacterium]